jgi:hypothetical protein
VRCVCCPGGGYDQSIRTALRLNIAPEDAILRQTQLGHYDLIVMSAGRAAGKTRSLSTKSQLTTSGAPTVRSYSY